MYLGHTMQELNENVTGNYVEEDPVALLDAKPDFFRIFTLVIATQVAPCRCRALATSVCLCGAALHCKPTAHAVQSSRLTGSRLHACADAGRGAAAARGRDTECWHPAAHCSFVWSHGLCAGGLGAGIPIPPHKLGA